MARCVSDVDVHVLPYRSAPYLQLGDPRLEFTIPTLTPEGTNRPEFLQKGLFVIFMDLQSYILKGLVLRGCQVLKAKYHGCNMKNGQSPDRIQRQMKSSDSWDYVGV